MKEMLDQLLEVLDFNARLLRNKKVEDGETIDNGKIRLYSIIACEKNYQRDTEINIVLDSQIG